MINLEFEKYTQRFDTHRAFCVALIFTFGLFLYLYCEDPYGFWIPMTIAIIFSNSHHETVIQRSVDRISGTFLGLIIIYIYTVLFIDVEYGFAYFVILAYFILFYIEGITSNYFFCVIFITIGAGLYESISSITTSSPEVTLYSRLFATAIGVTIAIFGEYLIRISSNSIIKERKQHIRQYFFTIADIITTINTSFVSDKFLSKNLLKEIRSYIGEINSIEGTYINIRQEMEFSKENEAAINIFFHKTNTILSTITRIIAIVSYEKMDSKIITQKELIYIGDLLSSKYESIIKLIYGKKDETTKILSNIKSKLQFEKMSNATVLYVKELLKLNDVLDDFIFQLNNSNEKACSELS